MTCKAVYDSDGWPTDVIFEIREVADMLRDSRGLGDSGIVEFANRFKNMIPLKREKLMGSIYVANYKVEKIQGARFRFLLEH